jgi:hypothetical protein
MQMEALWLFKVVRITRLSTAQFPGITLAVMGEQFL